MWHMTALRRSFAKEHKVEVHIGDRKVGTMAETSNHRVAFAYSDEWLGSGYALSLFSLSMEQEVFVPSASAFSGLWGVFAGLDELAAQCQGQF